MKKKMIFIDSKICEITNHTGENISFYVALSHYDVNDWTEMKSMTNDV